MTPSVPFEILIATMFRSDFTFLEAMFPAASCWDYHILIINQTDAGHQLTSKHPKVRVINTEERGLSRSRNMALENAIGDICIIADDDIEYVKNVGKIVVSAFAKAEKASIITFKKKNQDGLGNKTYPNIREHTLRTAKDVSSWEIAFRRDHIQKLEIRFDERFGLGADFPIGEESIFVTDVMEHGDLCLFEPNVILEHRALSSGSFPGRDDIVFARGALRYKFMGNLAYLSMIKYAWFYYRRGDIALKEIPSKIKIAFAGIKKYKELQNLNQ